MDTTVSIASLFSGWAGKNESIRHHPHLKYARMGPQFIAFDGFWPSFATHINTHTQWTDLISDREYVANIYVRSKLVAQFNRAQTLDYPTLINHDFGFEMSSRSLSNREQPLQGIPYLSWNWYGQMWNMLHSHRNSQTLIKQHNFSVNQVSTQSTLRNAREHINQTSGQPRSRVVVCI